MDTKPKMTMTVQGELACMKLLAQVLMAMAPDSRKRAVEWMRSFTLTHGDRMPVDFGLPPDDVKNAIEARMPANG